MPTKITQYYRPAGELKGMSGNLDELNSNAHEKNIEHAREQIVRSMKPGNDPQLRQYGSLLLGQLKDSGGIDPLIRALRDPDKKVRAQAARSLGVIGDPSVASLISLMDDPDWRVRYRAAEALGITRSHKAVPRLIAALEDPKDHVRYMAAKALGETGSDIAETALIARLTDDNEFVRRSTVTALGKTGGPAAKQALSVSLKTDPSDEVRKVIRNTIINLEKKVV